MAGNRSLARRRIGTPRLGAPHEHPKRPAEADASKASRRRSPPPGPRPASPSPAPRAAGPGADPEAIVRRPKRRARAFPVEIDPKRIEETLEKIRAEVTHWTNKGRYTKVRFKFRGTSAAPGPPARRGGRGEGALLLLGRASSGRCW